MLTPLNYVHRSKPTRVSFSIPAIVLGILTLGVIGGKSVNASSLRAVPLAELTEKTDLWVRGKVLLVESHSLEEDERYKFDFQGSVEIKAVIRVVQSVPETAPNLLTIHWVSGDEISKSIVPDRECIAAVQLRDDGDYKSYSQLGIYGWFQPDSTTKMIRHVQEIGEGISPDLLWELVSALRWGLDKRGGLQPELAEIWRKRLLEGNFHEFAAATLVFQVSPNSAPSPEAIVDAFERQYRAIESQLKNPSGRVQLSAEKRNVAAGALTVFLKIGNEACAERLVSLCERTFQDEQKKIFEEEPTETESLVRAILASGGPRRVELLSRLISRNPAHSSDPSKYMGRPTIIRARFSVTHVIGEQKGEDIDKLLIDMLHHPDYYDIQESLDFAAVWEALARRGNPELERYLLSLLQNSQSSDLKVPDYRSVDTYASESLRIYYERLPHAQKIHCQICREPQISA
ncbi:MAG: hypothetical protein HYV26_24090 [Candidatus Hydrogenedentes bacterium]|nr:hypothetical protein [Candidatus Hydrogenedentota bacterium]